MQSPGRRQSQRHGHSVCLQRRPPGLAEIICFAQTCPHWLHSLPSALPRYSDTMFRCNPRALPGMQHYVGTTWHADEDEDAPAPAPTLRAMPLRPRYMPTVILAGAIGVLGGFRAQSGNPGKHLCPPSSLRVRRLPSVHDNAPGAHREPCACLTGVRPAGGQALAPAASAVAALSMALLCPRPADCGARSGRFAYNKAYLFPFQTPFAIAAGDEAATIVSERGNEVDSWELPDRPLMPLQVGWAPLVYGLVDC